MLEEGYCVHLLSVWYTLSEQFSVRLEFLQVLSLCVIVHLLLTTLNY